MKKKEYLSKEGYAVVGSGFEVYNEQGFGLLEEIYQESMEIELEKRAIPFSAKQQLQVFYKDLQLKKKYIPDLFTHNAIMVELKSVKELLPEHEAQLLNYMRITHSAVGYLLNFGQPKDLEWKRFILSEFIPDSFDKDQRSISED